MTSDPGSRSGDELQVSVGDGTCRIRINRPDSLNSVTADVLHDMADAVEQAGTDPEVRVVVLSGAGRAFCSGADIVNSRRLDSPDEADDDSTVATLDAANRLVAAVRDVPRPVVSVVQGPCAGVGVSVAVAADLVLASSQAFFMLAFAKIGLMPDGGATALVAASAGRAKAMRMALLAERMSADEAAAAGLVTHVLDSDSFDAGAESVIDQLRSGPMAAFARTKHAINAATLGPLDAALALEREGQIGLLASDDFEEGIDAFRTKRTPTFGDTA